MNPNYNFLGIFVPGYISGTVVKNFSNLMKPSSVFLGLVFISGCSQEQEQSIPALTAVTVSTAKNENIKPSIEFVGRAESTDDIKIRSRVGGVLVKRFFKQGEDIKKDDLLFEIDQAPYKTAVNEQKAKFDKARSDLKVAKRNFKRGKSLVKKNVLSQVDMDKLTNKLDSAQSAIRQAQAGVDTATLNLGYTTIKAPLSGRVGKSLFALGDVITQATDTLTTLVNMDPMYVSFQVNEKAMISFNQEALGHKNDSDKDPFIVELRLSNGSLYSEQGKIDFLSNRVDSSTGTMNVRALFNNPDNLLLPGQYMDVIILLNDKSEAILIPQSAVQEDQQGRFVMTVADNNKVARTRVEMGQRYGIKWEVVSGLSVGNRVIVEGLQKVRPGLEVTATEQTITPFESITKMPEKIPEVESEKISEIKSENNK